MPSSRPGVVAGSPALLRGPSTSSASLFLASLALLFLSTPTGTGATASKPEKLGPEEARALFAKVVHKYSLEAKNGVYLRIRARLEVGEQENAAVWTAEVERVSRLRWRKRLQSEEYEETEVVLGNTLWKKRNLPYRVPDAAWLLDLLQPGIHLSRQLQQHDFRKARIEKVEGRPAYCWRFGFRVASEVDTEICVEPATHHLLRFRTGPRVYTYGPSLEVDEDNWVPTWMSGDWKGSAPIRAELVDVEVLDIEEVRDWTPPAGAVAWPWCDDWRGAVASHLIERPFFAVIDERGIPRGVRVFGATSPKIRQMLETRVLRTKFLPARCGDRPVASEYFWFSR